MVNQLKEDNKSFLNTNLDPKKLLLRPDRTKVTFERQKQYHLQSLQRILNMTSTSVMPNAAISANMSQSNLEDYSPSAAQRHLSPLKLKSTKPKAFSNRRNGPL